MTKYRITLLKTQDSYFTDTDVKESFLVSEETHAFILSILKKVGVEE